MQRRFFPAKKIQSVREIRNLTARIRSSIHQDKSAKEAKDNKVRHKFLFICKEKKPNIEHRATFKADIIKSIKIISANVINYGHECDLAVEIQSAVSCNVQKVHAQFFQRQEGGDD
jgi:hypothetical protein